ncbi:MAG: tetratricopeptide repeat protein [Bacteroidia bacterium]|nr:tetratricopeptide repeat protein [Bacteroidia bacterium]
MNPYRISPNSFRGIFALAFLAIFTWTTPLIAQTGETISRAYEAAWSGNYRQAQDAFDKILRQDPDHSDALSGKAWAYAWQGDFQAATLAFEKLEVRHPAHPEAEKGRAYVALWSGNYPAAKTAFTRLLLSQPEGEIEWREALSMIYMQQGQHLKARNQLSLLGPEHQNPALNTTLQSSPAFFETSFWGGYSRVDASNRFGLRALQITYNPVPDQSLWVRMDNSLTLDHHTLFSRDTGALAFFVGGKIMPHKKVILSGELGQRLIPNQGNQQIFSVESTWFLRKKLGWKNGGLYVNNTFGVNQKMAFSGLIWEAMPSIWLEPQLFYIWENSTTPSQLRGNLNLKYRKADTGQEWNIGATFAPELAMSDPTIGTTTGAWLLYQHPLGQKHWIFGLARFEKNDVQSLVNLALGMRFRLEQ